MTPEEEGRAMKLLNDFNNPKSGRTKLTLTEDEQRILRTIQARKMLQCEATINLNHFAGQTVNGMAPRLERGLLGLQPVAQKEKPAMEAAYEKRVAMDDESMVAAKEVKSH